MIPLRKVSEIGILQLLKNYYCAVAMSAETEAYVSVYFPHLPFQIIWPTVEDWPILFWSPFAIYVILRYTNGEKCHQ